MALNINELLGNIIQSPLFWILAMGVFIVIILWKLGVFDKKRKPFKPETLEESLKTDLRPRMKIQGQKVKKEYLIQNYQSFGKIRKWALGTIQFETRKVKNPDNPKGKRGRKKTKPEVELVKETAEVIYFTVGGNMLLAWIPYIGRKYEPYYFVIDREYVKRDVQARKWDIHPDIHVYPYGTVWISSLKTQGYLTELEARRSQEFEAETNINTLKRWSYYNEPISGKIVIKEKDAHLEKEKWDAWREGED